MSNTTDTGLAVRLDKIESRMAIEELIAQYAHGFDSQDVELVKSVFHDDALLALGPPFGDFDGLESIGTAANDLWEQSPLMHHWMANVVIEIDGDEATGLAALDGLVMNVDDGPSMVIGNYRDRYERRDGRWAIAERHFEMQAWAPLDGWKATRGSQA